MAKVKEHDTGDPLEKRGLSMNDLEGPLGRLQNDPEVMMALQAMMSGGEEPSEPSATAKATSSAKIIEINEFMLEELRKFVTDFEAHRKTSSKTWDVKTVVIASQALLDSKVTEKFGLSS